VLIGVVLVFTQQQRPSLVLRGKDLAERSPSPERESPPSPAHPAPTDKSEEASVQLLTSDWVKLKLRTESEFLRLFRPGDHAALNRLTSKTLRGALEQAGVGRDMIDERPGTVAAAGVGHAPVQWKIQVPPRASLFRINDAVTQAILVLGGDVIRGTERPAQIAGTALDLRVGYGDRVTHSIMVEPNPAIVDAGAQIAFIVLDLDRDSENVYRSFLESPIPFTFALRPDLPSVSREAKELRSAKQEIFLHLPMEPRGYPQVDPGKDAILLDLSQVEIEERMNRCLANVGPSQGVITRMGGAAVNDPDVMRAVLKEVKRRNLVFVDAHGGGPTIVEELGEEMGARTLTLGGSFDGATGSPAAVRARLKQLLALASQRGTLVVGVKANALVLSVLESERPKWLAEGVEVVPASHLVL